MLLYGPEGIYRSRLLFLRRKKASRGVFYVGQGICQKYRRSAASDGVNHGLQRSFAYVFFRLVIILVLQLLHFHSAYLQRQPEQVDKAVGNRGGRRDRLS